MSAKEKKKTETEETSTEEEKTEGEVITVRHEFVTPEPKKTKDNPVKKEPEEKKEPAEKKTEKKVPEKKTETPKDEDPKLKELREKLEAERGKVKEYETIIQAEALKSFKDEKEKFLGLIPDEEKRKQAGEMIGDDPEKLEQAKFLTDFFAKSLQGAGVKVTGTETEEGAGKETKEGEKKTGTETETKEGEKKTGTETETEKDENVIEKGPAGKATLPPQVTGYGQYKQIVDELYGILLDPSKTEAEKNEANRKIDELFVQMVKGLREHPQTRISISECPQCKALLTANAKSCPSCGWQHIKTRSA